MLTWIQSEVIHSENAEEMSPHMAMKRRMHPESERIEGREAIESQVEMYSPGRHFEVEMETESRQKVVGRVVF